MEVGQRVECRYQEGPQFYAGVIKGRRARLLKKQDKKQQEDDSGKEDDDDDDDDASKGGVYVYVYDVVYDDDDAESNVRRLRLRLPGQKQAKLLMTGEPVDARCTHPSLGR